MAALTDDPQSPETLDLDEYTGVFRAAFPSSPPAESVHALVNLGCDHNWFPHRFVAADDPRNNTTEYCDLWQRALVVDWTALVNDAAILCIRFWSSDHCLSCIDDDADEQNSLFVVTGMLYLSLTWPGN